MRFLQATIGSCESDIADVLKENKKEWIKRRNGGTAYDSSVGGIGTNQSVTIPLDPGDCDEFLGLPLCVVCQSVRLQSQESREDPVSKQEGQPWLTPKEH